MIKNNNPGNIRWNSVNNWVGQIGKDSRGFVIFDELKNGTRAMQKLIGNYINSGVNTISKIIYKYAPPNENNTENYIRQVLLMMNGSGASVVNRNTIINPANKAQFLKLINSMIRIESGESLSLNQLETGYSLAFSNSLPNNENHTIQTASFSIWPLLLISLLIFNKR